MKIEFVNNEITDFQIDEIVGPYLDLIKRCGWDKRETSSFRLALSRSRWLGLAYLDTEMIGAIRAIGDGIFTLVFYDLVVHPEYRHLGVGTQLLDCLFSWSKKQGIRDVECISVPEAIGFYTRQGGISVPAYRFTITNRKVL